MNAIIRLVLHATAFCSIGLLAFTSHASPDPLQMFLMPASPSDSFGKGVHGVRVCITNASSTAITLEAQGDIYRAFLIGEEFGGVLMPRDFPNLADTNSLQAHLRKEAHSGSTAVIVPPHGVRVEGFSLEPHFRTSIPRGHYRLILLRRIRQWSDGVLSAEPILITIE